MGSYSRIMRNPGAKPDVRITLADNICAPMTGLNETEKLNMVRLSATSQVIPKEHKFTVSNIARQTLGVFSHTPGDQVSGLPDKLSVEGKVGCRFTFALSFMISMVGSLFFIFSRLYKKRSADRFNPRATWI